MVSIQPYRPISGPYKKFRDDDTQDMRDAMRRLITPGGWGGLAYLEGEDEGDFAR